MHCIPIEAEDRTCRPLRSPLLIPRSHFKTSITAFARTWWLEIGDRVLEVPFVARGRRDDARGQPLKPEHFTQPNEYFLGVKSRQDPRAVATLVEDADKFKLTTRKLVGRAFFGLRLQEEPQPAGRASGLAWGLPTSASPESTPARACGTK